MTRHQELTTSEPYLLAQSVAATYSPKNVRFHDRRVNIVAEVDERFVIKVPQPAMEWSRSVLQRERTALTFLQNVSLGHVAIPQLVEFSEDPLYMVASYIKGTVITEREAQSLSRAQRTTLGRDIGNFIFRQASMIRPGDMPIHLAELGNASWPAAFDRYLSNFSNSRYPTLRDVITQAYPKWQAYTESTDQANEMAIHGDLTISNITLTDDHRLQGVFDFARMHVGDLAEECCALSIDESILSGCLRELDDNGLSVDPEAVKLWREMKDLRSIAAWTHSGGAPPAGVVTARGRIVNAYPLNDWSELYAA